MKLYAVGDIHGCARSLRNLYAKILEDVGEEEYRIVFLGDYIDRGPNSKGVLDFLIDLDPEKHVFLRGNHEDMFLNVLNIYDEEFMFGSTSYNDAEYQWKINGGMRTLYSYTQSDYSDIRVLIPEKHMNFLRRTKRIHRETDETGRIVTFVHAGYDPGKRMEDQTEICLLWNRDFVGYNGEFLDTDLVIHGHTPKEKPIITEHQIGIDTGACFNGELTAVKIGNEIEFLSVPGQTFNSI